jgi:hypothetical protein
MRGTGGTMADDVMDSDGRAEAALAAFSGDDGQQQQQQDDGQQRQAADGQQQQQDAQRAEGDQQQQQQEPGKLSDEQLQADPRFQELSTLKDSLVDAFSEFPGLVDDKGGVNVQEASLQLKDASILYDIMQGKGTPSALLEVMAKNGGWSDGQKQLIAQDLIGWLTANKYLKDGQAAAKSGDAGLKDPVQARLDKIEQERQTERQTQEQQRVRAHQEDVYNNKFMPEVKRLCTQKGVPAENVGDYAARIAAQVKGNKAIIGRIEKGNFVDVNKMFTQAYNAEVQRLQRWTKAQTKAADAKNKNPRIPAGGATPAPGGSAKGVNVKDRDSRIAAAESML